MAHTAELIIPTSAELEEVRRLYNYYDAATFVQDVRVPQDNSMLLDWEPTLMRAGVEISTGSELKRGELVTTVDGAEIVLPTNKQMCHDGMVIGTQLGRYFLEYIADVPRPEGTERRMYDLLCDYIGRTIVGVPLCFRVAETEKTLYEWATS